MQSAPTGRPGKLSSYFAKLYWKVKLKMDDIRATPEQSATVTESHFECSLCFSLLCDTVTTSCGHSFCRACLLQSMDVAQACPMCRSPLHLNIETAAQNHFITSLIEQLFPVQAAKRAKEVAIERRHRRARYGLFFTDTSMHEGQLLRLHVFEHKYRVMLNRAMQSHRCFIAVSPVNEQLWARMNEDQRRGVALLPELQPGGVAAAQQQAAGQNATPPVPLDVAERFVQWIAPMSVEGLRRFGILPPPIAELDSATRVPPAGAVGCLVRIHACHAGADGRSWVEARAEKRVALESLQEEEQAFGLISAETVDIVDQQAADDDERHQQQQQQHDVPLPDAEAQQQEARQLTQLQAALQRYLRISNQTLEQLSQLHGTAPQDRAGLVAFVCRAVGNNTLEHRVVKLRILHSSNASVRTRLACQLLDSATAKSQLGAQLQVIAFVCVILSFLMIKIGSAEAEAD